MMLKKHRISELEKVLITKKVRMKRSQSTEYQNLKGTLRSSDINPTFNRGGNRSRVRGSNFPR